MSSLNKVFLIGRLGKDPEFRQFENGNSKAAFSIATSEVFKDKDGTKKETTTWHNIVLWNKTAEVAAKYLHKGDLVHLEGKITNRSWEKDGVTKYITEIVCFALTMLSTKPKESSAPAGGGMPIDNDFDSSAPPPGTYTTTPATPAPVAPATSVGGFAASDDLPF